MHKIHIDLQELQLIPRWHLLTHIAQEAFQLWGQPEEDWLASSCTNQCQPYYILENQLPEGVLDISGELFNFCHALVPLVLSRFLAEHGTG